jgi:hypothetical protein
VSTRRVNFGLFARIAAGVAVLVGVTGALALLRGPNAEDIRRMYREAQGAGTLAAMTQGYESVVRDGMQIPEVRNEVDDALLQVQAIHQFERAVQQPNADVKKIQLVDVMIRFPGSQVTPLALEAYKELFPQQGAPKYAPPKNRWDEPGAPRFGVDPSFVQRYTENLESQYVAVRDLDDSASLRKKKELKPALVAAHLQWAQSEHDSKDVKILHYKKALEYAEPNSPAALDAMKQLNALTAH